MSFSQTHHQPKQSQSPITKQIRVSVIKTKKWTQLRLIFRRMKSCCRLKNNKKNKMTSMENHNHKWKDPLHTAKCFSVLALWCLLRGMLLAKRLRKSENITDLLNHTKNQLYLFEKLVWQKRSKKLINLKLEIS